MSIFSDKAVSSFPIAIGTSMALESLFQGRIAPYDPNREIPNKINIGNYSEAWFNLSTLFRNLISALPSKAIDYVSPKDIARELAEEMEMIQDLFRIEGTGLIQPRFFVTTYNDVRKKYSAKKIVFREPTTSLQKVTETKYLNSVGILLKEYEGLVTELSSSDLNPYTRQGKAFIVTHLTYDLTSYSNFNKFDLLESHTGKLKTRKEFSQRYLPIGKTKLDNFPFSKRFLMVFGDRTMIHPAFIKIRRMLVDIAEKRKFTPFTTKSKVDYYIKSDVKEELVKRWLLDL